MVSKRKDLSNDLFDGIKIYLYIFIFIIVIYYVIHFLSLFLTKFQKTIVVTEKYIKPYKNYSYYQFVDSNDKTYRLVDSIYLLEFNSGDDYAQLKVGKKYKIYGYWFRYPMFSWFPLVYKVSDI